jgi:hypothetical protein
LGGQRLLPVDLGRHGRDEHRGEVVERGADCVVATTQRVVDGAARDTRFLGDGGQAELSGAEAAQRRGGGGE